MKKYKLIKEYPGSPKLGTINTNDQLSWKAEDYPQFWEEVVEKDYEILSFIHNRTHGVKEGAIVKMKDGKLDSEHQNLNESHYLTDKVWSIHSIKRLNDGEIFTIGDDILEQREHSKIKYFEVRGDDLVLRIAHQVTGGSSLILISSEFTKYKQPLFTTEDGVDIFKNDIFWSINSKFEKIERQITNDKWSKDFIFKDKHFSTKEKAEEYILMNKPCLSLQEVQQVLKRTKKVNVSPLRVYIELRELSQKKLNNK